MKDSREFQISIVGDNLRRFRERLKMSQAALAHESGISSVAMYESCKRYPEPDILAKMAKALGVSVSELVSDPSESRQHMTMSDLLRLAREGELPDHLTEEIRRTKALESLLAILPRLTPNELEVISDKASAFIDLRSTAAKTKA